MPNKPPSPYGRFPVRAVIGLILMVGAPAIYLIAGLSGRDWKVALAVTLSLLASAALLLAWLNAVQWLRSRFFGRGTDRAATHGPSFAASSFRHSGPVPGAEPADAPDFDANRFLASARARNPESTRSNDDRSAQLAQERIRKLEDMRDHPSTPAPEKDAANRSIKLIRKRRPLPNWRKS